MIVYEVAASMADADRSAWLAERFPHASPRTLFVELKRFAPEAQAELRTPRLLLDKTTPARHEDWVDLMSELPAEAFNATERAIYRRHPEKRPPVSKKESGPP